MIENINFDPNLQYQVDPTDPSQEKDKKLVFDSLDHSKMIFYGFWMIQHVSYGYQTVNDIKYYQNMQNEIHPTD